VPGIIEWPAVIKPRVTHYPASTMDLFPTVADILALPASVMLKPVDGESLRPLFTEEIAERRKPIPFRYQGRAALVDNRFKLVSDDIEKGRFQLYDLVADRKESRDIRAEQPDVAARMERELLAWNDSVEASFEGEDYPEGQVTPPDPKPMSWTEHPDYAPHLSGWQERWEYKPAIKGGGKRSGTPAAPKAD
jgi:arylsulfatase A-like enzyme